MASSINVNRPADTLRERGGLKATIWKNSSAQGRPFFSVDVSRTYRDEQGYHDSRSFGEEDLLALANLLTKSHDRVRELRAADAASEPMEADVAA